MDAEAQITLNPAQLMATDRASQPCRTRSCGGKQDQDQDQDAVPLDARSA